MFEEKLSEFQEKMPHMFYKVLDTSKTWYPAWVCKY
jgi:hypothetical protein